MYCTNGHLIENLEVHRLSTRNSTVSSRPFVYIRFIEYIGGFNLCTTLIENVKPYCLIQELQPFFISFISCTVGSSSTYIYWLQLASFFFPGLFNTTSIKALNSQPHNKNSLLFDLERLNLVCDELAMVFSVGKTLWCIFEGCSHSYTELHGQKKYEVTLKFLHFSTTPESLKLLIRRCTIHWEHQSGSRRRT